MLLTLSTVRVVEVSAENRRAAKIREVKSPMRKVSRIRITGLGESFLLLIGAEKMHGRDDGSATFFFLIFIIALGKSNFNTLK